MVFDGYANHRVYAKNARYPGLNMSRCIGGGKNGGGVRSLMLDDASVWKFFSAKVVMRGAKWLNEKLMDYALLMTCESTARSDRLGDIKHLSTCYISWVWQFSQGCNRGK